MSDKSEQELTLKINELELEIDTLNEACDKKFKERVELIRKRDIIVNGNNKHRVREYIYIIKYSYYDRCVISPSLFMHSQNTQPHLYRREVANSEAISRLLKDLLYNCPQNEICAPSIENLIKVVDEICTIYNENIIPTVNEYFKNGILSNENKNQEVKNEQGSGFIYLIEIESPNTYRIESCLNMNLINHKRLIYTHVVENPKVIETLLGYLLSDSIYRHIHPASLDNLIKVVEAVCTTYSKTIIPIVNEYIKNEVNALIEGD